MPRQKSFILVLTAALVVAVCVPLVRALARGTDAAAASVHVAARPASTTHDVGFARDGSDELSMLAVGAFLLGLGGVLRRVA